METPFIYKLRLIIQLIERVKEIEKMRGEFLEEYINECIKECLDEIKTLLI
jgi:poly(3-hydroxyalkanoate) synthetase